MILQGQFSVAAPREKVWEAIWDVRTLASWMPGCTSVEQLGERTYRVHLEQQISMFRAAFDLRVEVVESEPPNRVVVKGQGEDRRMASSLQIQTEVRLHSENPGATTISYRHDLSIFGRLGALGFPLIQRKAREAEAEFARRARESLGGG
jgi:carbon monoxide dehydrogenase subunit G